MNPVQISVARILIAVTLYGVMCGVLIWLKPKAMFDEAGRPRTFGVEQAENNQSIFAPVIVFPILAVICYFIASFWELTRAPVPRALKITA